MVDLVVLIYFIHHIAKSIQLPEVIAGIAKDLMHAIDAEFPVRDADERVPVPAGGDKPVPELLKLLDERGGTVVASTSGYLQFVGYAQLVTIASRTDAVIRLDHRPGHFVVAGAPWLRYGPRSGRAGPVGPGQSTRDRSAPHAHSGSYLCHRSAGGDPDRALSPAVNDTFTALTCIDWLSAGPSRLSGRTLVEAFYRDSFGRVRLIVSDPSYAKMVNRASTRSARRQEGCPP